MAREYTIKRQPKDAVSRIDYAAELNEKQYAAVTAPPGPSLVIAGAGSGKTRTLTYRVAYLLDNAIPASNILLLTFTNKAAREMLERVEELLPGRARDLWGGTFHSIGNRILRRHASLLGWSDHFSIMDREDQKELLGSVLTAAKVDTKASRFPKADVIGDILSLANNTAKSLETVIAERYPYFSPHIETIADIGRAYEAKKLETNSMDFDDLLVKCLVLFQDYPVVLEQYQRQFEWVLVDEYQDTNAIQAEWIARIAAPQNNLMVVGDDAQSIYSWRGADFRNILEFPDTYEGVEKYVIETNYRSVPEILSLANAAIAPNTRQFRKELAPWRANREERPAFAVMSNPQMQAAFVAQRIQELQEEGIPLDEMAVLYRAHFHAMEVQLELTKRGIPFVITSGLRFFEQAHIKDVASFMRFAANRKDEVAFKRFVRMQPGIGARTADRLWADWLGSEAARSETLESFSDTLLRFKVPAKSEAAWKQLAYTLDELLDPTGLPQRPEAMIASILGGVYEDHMKVQFTNFEARLQDVHQLKRYASDFEDLDTFLSQLSLLAGQDAVESGSQDRDQESVCLSSVHQAKGLEWKVVFVIWLADGRFPSSRVLEEHGETSDALEEERRLFYVAVTRARDELYLTYPVMWHGAFDGEVLQIPSRFLEEIPGDLVEEWKVGAGW